MWGNARKSAGPAKWAGKSRGDTQGDSRPGDTDPTLSTQRIPRGRDPILSTQRIPRGRDRILSTQRIGGGDVDENGCFTDVKYVLRKRSS